MQFYPNLADFSKELRRGKAQLVWTKIVTDLESPVAMMMKLMPEEDCTFLLESVSGGENRGRYSIIALNPDLIWRCKQEQAEISTSGLKDENFHPCTQPTISSLKQLIRKSRLEIPAQLPPMAAGLIGFMGYDMIKQVEKLPHNNPDNINIPDGCFMRPRVSIIHDSVDAVTYIVAPVWELNQEPEIAYNNACNIIEDILHKLQQTQSAQYVIPTEQEQQLHFTSNVSVAEYKQIVEQAKNYIKDGEIFQVVPSQRFHTKFNLPPFALYRALRHTNPSPFLFFLNLGSFSLIGSSPEILVRLRDNKISIRPIAGTRPRSPDYATDQQLAMELLADTKEQAEHLMLLDLGRNDVGKVAKPGTVQVTEKMVIERYSHVMHIVSNVEGELQDEFDAVDALMAGFPAGTVSGAPKIRAMEIIDELEPETRSFYAGCVGYFSANGSMDSCITLRTGLVKDGNLFVQAGGGVVADSDPISEYEESCNKAKALMHAASIAHNFV